MNIDSFLAQIGLTQNPADVYLGGIRLIDIPEISDQIIRKEESRKNSILQAFQIDEQTRFLAKIIQLITFEEYLSLFDLSIAKKSIIFEKLGLQTIERRYLFTQANEPTLQGYEQFIKTNYPRQAPFFLKWLNAHISERERMKHTYIVAAARSGKSELLKVLIHHYIKNGNHGVFVLDPSGKLTNEVMRFKEFLDPTLQEKLIVFDPYLGHDKGKYPIINPFNFHSKDVLKLDRATDELTRAINQILADKMAGFSDQMELIVRRMVAVLLFKGDADFTDLVRFFYEDKSKDLIELALNHPNDQVRNFFAERWGKDDAGKTKDTGLNSSIPSLRTRIENLTGDTLFRYVTTGKSTIDLEKALDKGNYVILNLSKGELSEDLGRVMGKLIMAQIQILSLQRQGKTPHSYKAVHIFIDEMQNFITHSIEQILTESAKYKIYLTLANQYIGQTDNPIGAGQFYTALLGNTGVKIVGKAGNATISEMSEEMSIKKEFLNRLTQGRFYVKVEGKMAAAFKTFNHLLDNNNSMTAEQWEQLKAKQLAQYYELPMKQQPNKGKETPTVNPNDPTPQTTKIKPSLGFE